MNPMWISSLQPLSAQAVASAEIHAARPVTRAALPSPLQLGAVTQQLQVSANAAMVETQDTSIPKVVGQRRVIDLALAAAKALKYNSVVKF
jgi:hypothetical protein